LLDGGQDGEPVLYEIDFMTRGPEQVAKHQAHLFIVVGEKQVTHESTGVCAVEVEADS
jgi:hypothetical protein